jgi:hypothetical protein
VTPYIGSKEEVTTVPVIYGGIVIVSSALFPEINKTATH